MANFCCVPLCHGRSPRDKTSFHHFTGTDNEPEQRTSWKRAPAVRRDFAVITRKQVCGKHCSSGAFQERDNGKRCKENDAVPCLGQRVGIQQKYFFLIYGIN